MDQEKVIVIDFGGQYNQLVARRVRECNVYCEIYSYKTDLAQIKAMNPKGIILTGGPNSCYEDGAPTCTKELFELGVPVLGLCYGAQLMQHVLGGKVEKAPVREYGKTETFVDKSSALFSDVSEKTIVWMSHFDYISQIAPGFKIVAHTADCPVAAAECTEKNLYAIQFHPEVLHTQEGTKMLHNFVRGVCGCAGTWKMDAFVENTIKEIREKVGSGKVLLALSGGVDSSVAAGLLSRAIGKQLTCVFVDHGLLRLGELDGDLVRCGALSIIGTLAVGATGKRRHKAKRGRGKERRQSSLGAQQRKFPKLGTKATHAIADPAAQSRNDAGQTGFRSNTSAK